MNLANLFSNCHMSGVNCQVFFKSLDYLKIKSYITGMSDSTCAITNEGGRLNRTASGALSSSGMILLRSD